MSKDRATPLELEFITHYREMDLESGTWDGVRIRRLCNLLNLTQNEFARFIRLTPHKLEEYITKEKWPGCIKLVLDLAERTAFKTYLGSAFKRSLFPNTHTNG